MEASVDFVLRKMTYSIQELFKDGDEFVEFKRDDDSGSRSGTNSQSVSGHIVYRRQSQILFSPPLFLKISPDIVSFETLNLLFYINEVYFYSKVQPYFQTLRSTDRWLLKFYLSHLDVTCAASNEIFVLKDMRTDGFIDCIRKNRFLDYDHLSLMMRKLGEFHAYSYKARAADHERYSKMVSSFKNPFPTIIKECYSRTVQRWEMASAPLRQDSKYGDGMRKFDIILEKLGSFVLQSLEVDDENGLTNVLCHNSFTKSNTLFRYDGDKPVDAIILDWQTCVMCSVGIDVLLPLYIDSDQKTRDDHWDDLMDEYYRTLSLTFPEVTVPTKNQLMENLKMKVGIVLYVAAARIPHENFSVHPKFKFTRTESFDELIDPLTEVLKDMINRNLLY